MLYSVIIETVCVIIGSGEVNVYNTKKMEPGKWYNVRIQIQSGTLTLRIADETGETESSIEIPEYITIHDVMRDGAVSVLGKGYTGDYFNGSIDSASVYFKPVDAPEYKYTERKEIAENPKLRGDVNADGKCDIADAVLLQKNLLTVETALPDWQAGDMDENGRLNAIDLTLLKRLLMQ